MLIGDSTFSIFSSSFSGFSLINPKQEAEQHLYNNLYVELKLSFINVHPLY